MHTVVRTYRDNTALFDELEKRADEVEAVIRGVSGFVAYYLVRSGSGGFSVSVFEDEAGTTASTQAAAAWIRENVPSVGGSPPEVMEGTTVINF